MSTEIQTPPSLPEHACGTLSNSDWLRTLSWRKSASKKLIRAAAAGDVDRFADAFRRQLPVTNRQRPRRKLINQLGTIWGSERSAPSAWKVSPEFAAELSARLTPTDVQGLRTAFWLLALPDKKMDARTFITLWRSVHDQTREFAEQISATDGIPDFSHLETLESLWIRALLFQSLRGGKRSLAAVRHSISAALENSTDSDGTPHAKWLPEIDSVFDTLSRMLLCGQRFQADLLSGKRSELLVDFLGRCASLYGPDGRAFAAQNPELLSRLETCVSSMQADGTAGLHKLIRAWQTDSGNQNGQPAKRRISTWRLSDECHQSDWAEWACLRSNWESPVDRCVLTHDSVCPAIDLLVRNRPLLSGLWTFQLEVDGSPIELSDDWSCVCWFCDEEACFAEIEQEIAPTLRIIRQIFLDRDDSLLVLADSVRCKEDAELKATSCLPLLSNWTFEEDSKTRESALRSSRSRVRILPVSAPQYRVQKADGTVSCQEGKLIQRSSTLGTGLYQALVLDWNRKRREQPADWESLTVAEDGRIVDSSTARAFRFRIGVASWLLYHSLQQPAIPRSVLGLHTSHETVLARIENRECAPLVGVDL